MELERTRTGSVIATSGDDVTVHVTSQALDAAGGSASAGGSAELVHIGIVGHKDYVAAVEFVPDVAGPGAGNCSMKLLSGSWDKSILQTTFKR